LASSAAPLSLGITYPVGSASESSEEEPAPAGDRFLAFERQRKAALAKFDSDRDPVLSVTLKSERLKTTSDPQLIENPNYGRPHSAPAERVSQQAMRLQPVASSPERRNAASPRRSDPGDDDVEFVINDSWIKSLSMDADTDAASGFLLAQLPSAPTAPQHARRTRRSDADEDPVEEARKAALSRQMSAPVEREQGRSRHLSAEQYAHDWGFATDVGQMIERVMKQK
jgi:hypothetical protein